MYKRLYEEEHKLHSSSPRLAEAAPGLSLSNYMSIKKDLMVKGSFDQYALCVCVDIYYPNELWLSSSDSLVDKIVWLQTYELGLIVKQREF